MGLEGSRPASNNLSRKPSEKHEISTGNVNQWNLDVQAYGPAWDNSAEKAIRLEFCWGCELVESGPGGLQASLGQSCKGNHKENMRVL